MPKRLLSLRILDYRLHSGGGRRWLSSPEPVACSTAGADRRYEVLRRGPQELEGSIRLDLPEPLGPISTLRGRSSSS